MGRPAGQGGGLCCGWEGRPQGSGDDEYHGWFGCPLSRSGRSVFMAISGLLRLVVVSGARLEICVCVCVTELIWSESFASFIWSLGRVQK